jgi:hypothetical protein
MPDPKESFLFCISSGNAAVLPDALCNAFVLPSCRRIFYTALYFLRTIFLVASKVHVGSLR